MTREKKSGRLPAAPVGELARCALAPCRTLHTPRRSGGRRAAPARPTRRPASALLGCGGVVRLFGGNSPYDSSACDRPAAPCQRRAPAEAACATEPYPFGSVMGCPRRRCSAERLFIFINIGFAVSTIISIDPNYSNKV
ncbi:hypothetical protein EVAR_20244_1 [Eumeta japonica]|uniref:Uncharacterized protein n=1 Tax=Eumeta variegata TaxID=151549 RepID=A0A4C1W8K9_EUMVA|nr:hypothetical protein EVAR_20244_1 [Eumeta japonica]